MAGEEPNELNYVVETVLKKRKEKEDWAIKRRERLDAKKKRKGEYKSTIKRPEQFIKEYRDKELDFFRMRNRVKLRKISVEDVKSELLFVIRIRGKREMHPKSKKILNKLRLPHILSGVFLKATESNLKMLLMVEPFVTFGYPNLKSVKELIYKKGCGKIEKEIVPLTNNEVVEQALGQYGMICVEDIVHEIANVGPHFREANFFLQPFKLKCPEQRLSVSKRPFKIGGDTGNREDNINELISKFN
ncbi:large ribosomal subunit protein uL30z-like [Carex rostrata]